MDAHASITKSNERPSSRKFGDISITTGHESEYFKLGQTINMSVTECNLSQLCPNSGEKLSIENRLLTIDKYKSLRQCP